MAKSLPHRAIALTPQELGRISAELARHAPQGLLEELQQQNQELLNTLQELRERQAEIAQMHSRELDETNRAWWPSTPSSTTAPRPSSVCPI